MPKAAYKLENVSIRMVKEPPLHSEVPVRNPEDAVRLIKELLKDYDREVACVVNLRADGKPINMNIVSVGSVNASMVVPREVYKTAILSNAASIIMIHNHPSGRLEPSQEDRNVSDTLSGLGKVMGIPLLDHIIVGPGEDHFSFAEHSLLRDSSAEEQIEKVLAKKKRKAKAEER